MASLTHSIGGVSFNALVTGEARSSLGCYASDPDMSLIRFHAPGTNGNVVINARRSSQKIHAKMRYYGPAATCLSNFTSDREAWAGVPLTIVDSSGATYERCYLEPGSMNSEDPVGMGTNSYMNASANFTRDS